MAAERQRARAGHASTRRRNCLGDRALSPDALVVEIVLSEHAFVAGDEVRGNLDLRNVGDDVRNVRVWLEWRVRRGSRASGKTEPMTIDLAGRTLGGRAHPAFACKLPREPLSYAGALFSIEWVVVAHVDVAWARDPQVERAIEVRPSPHALSGKPSVLPLAAPLLPRFSRGKLVAPIVGTSIAASIAGAFVPGLAVGVLALGAGTLALALRNEWKRSRAWLGPTSAVLDPGSPTRGQSFALRVTAQPTVSLTWLHAAWRLIATEVVVTGSKNENVKREVVHQQSGALAHAGRTERGRDAFFEATIALENTVSPSFDADRNQLRWTLTVAVEAQPDTGPTVASTLETEFVVRA